MPSSPRGDGPRQSLGNRDRTQGSFGGVGGASGGDSNLTAVITSALDYKKYLDKRKQQIQMQVENAQLALGPERPRDEKMTPRDPMRDGLDQALREPEEREYRPERDTRDRAKAIEQQLERYRRENPEPRPGTADSDGMARGSGARAAQACAHIRGLGRIDHNWTPGREQQRRASGQTEEIHQKSGSTAGSLAGTAAAHAFAYAAAHAQQHQQEDKGKEEEAMDADGPIAKSTGSLNDYAIGKQIGHGAYAQVRFGVHKETGRKVAIKIYEKYKLLDPQRRKSVRREIKLMERLSHPHVITYYDAIDTPKQVYIIMEFLGGGSLHHYLKKRSSRRLEDHRARRLFVQVCHGLKYLHDRHIVHRDIKLENLLMDDHGTVKCIDFGFSTIVPPGKKIKVFCGTPSYMAPEIVGRREYAGPCADIWACGVLLYAMLCGCFPFKGANDRDLYRKITKGIFFIPDFVSSGARSLLNRMLTVDMGKRPTVNDILADPWVSSGGPEDLKGPAQRNHNTSISSAATTAASLSHSHARERDAQREREPVKSASGQEQPSDLSTEHVQQRVQARMAWTRTPDLEREEQRAPSRNAPSRAGSHAPSPAARDTPKGTPTREEKPEFKVEEEAIAKLERLGYSREEIIRQLREESSHLYKLYFRFLKALNAWDTK